MKKLILGATGSIGSSLAKKIVAEGGQAHLVGRDEPSITNLAKELNSTFTTCDVLEDNFADKIFNDLGPYHGFLASAHQEDPAYRVGLFVYSL